MDEFGTIMAALNDFDSEQTSKSVTDTIAKVKNIFNSNNSSELKIDTALQTIDELGSNPNLTPYARTQIWNLISLLESAIKSNGQFAAQSKTL